jgi:pimeloyl-ACP methyl ester carboxylesterase
MKEAPMQRADIDGITLEYEERGSGESVLFIHGALMAHTFHGMLDHPALQAFRLISYARRGYAGSTGDAGVPISRQAADCIGLLKKLDASPAHLVGHSSGGSIAIQVALQNPEAVRSLTLLEPALLDVPGAAPLLERAGASVPIFQAGDHAGAVDAFLKPICGAHYRDAVNQAAPAALEQATNDAASFFAGEFPALAEWALTKDDAAKIRQPVLSVLGANTGESIGLPVYTEIHERVLDWFPNAKPFVLQRAAHLLQVENPQGMSEGLAAFLAGVQSGAPA